MSYWKDRWQASQALIIKRGQREAAKRMKKYYQKLSRQIISEYESLYNEILVKKAAGENISPATLYQLDKYWQMQQQVREKCRAVGAKLNNQFGALFESIYKTSYNSIKLDGLVAFSTIDDGAISQIINSVWAADGKVWSERIWNNMTLLQSSLEEGLLECVVTGKKSSDLKKLLQERFSVSYNRADTLVRTEMAHIQTEAAKKRYSDYGLEQVEIWADPDERTCKVCGALHKKKYPVGAKVPIPAHPRCRCCIVPVIEN